MTVAGAIAWGRRALASGELTAHSKDCEILLAHAAGKDSSWVSCNRHEPLSECTVDEFQSLLIRRAAGTPVQYLVGAS